MSRSKPNDNGTPNPAARWFEWNGEHGTVRYYDKTAKQNVDVGADFTFLLLDQLGTVRGWHEATKSGIYSNEVKDTRQDVMLVKASKGGILAEGLYKQIKDRVNAVGGQFNANCYIAFKPNGGPLALGSIRFKGAALGAWMEFCKTNRADLYSKAVHIGGFVEGKKGRITFRVPVFTSAEVSDATNAAALALDKTLQEFLDSYLKRNKRDQVEAPQVAGEITAGAAESAYDDPPPPDDEFDSGPPPMTDDEIPFAWLLPLVLPALGLLGSLALVV